MTDAAAAGPPTILVVEDDDSIRALLQDLLEDEGFAVVPREDLRRAREVIDAGPLPDLAVIDYQLPDGFGTELCRTLRTRSVPCLVVSAYTHSLEPAIEVKAEAWIAKPFDRGDLVKAVRELLAPTGAIISRLGPAGDPPKVLRLDIG